MILEATITNLDELHDDFIKNYELGNFTEGVCEWNGDDALMGPKSFAHTFKKRAEEIKIFKEEIISSDLLVKLKNDFGENIDASKITVIDHEE